MDHEEAYHMQVDMDSLTISLKEQEDRFTLSESDYYGLNVPTLNINNDEDAKRWAELMAEEAESEVVKQPVKTLSQKEWNELFVKGKWEELTPQKSQSEMIVIPQRTLSQKAEDVKLKDVPILQKTEWSDCDSDGLFSDDDDDDIDLMDYINPVTGRRRVKIVDSDEESDDETNNKLVQLAPRAVVDLAEEVKKAKKDVEGEEEKDKTRQAKCWCFTMNNPKMSGAELEKLLIESEKVQGFVFQLEEGANGTAHFQGYIEFKNKTRMGGIRNMLPQSAHLSAANGDKESNLKYCTKEEGRKEGPWIWGTCTEKKGRGKRTDLDDFARAVYEAGEVTEEIEEMFPGHAMQFARQAKAISADRAMRDAKKAQKEYWMQVVKDEEEGKKTEGQLQIHNKLFFGPTAVGKTTMVMKMTMGKGLDLYTKAGWNKWFEGYKKEKHMLVDEFGTGFCDGKIENFNAMNNIGVNVQEVKGSHVLLHVTHAYFTTNKHPLHIWDEVKESGTYKAFIRRFAEVYWWNDKHELVILKNPGSKDDADDEAQWKKDYTRWMSFWNGKQLDDEHRTIVPGQAVKNYFTFGCNQPQTNIMSMF